MVTLRKERFLHANEKNLMREDDREQRAWWCCLYSMELMGMAKRSYFGGVKKGINLGILMERNRGRGALQKFWEQDRESRPRKVGAYEI